jgi:hypothetical protein
MKCAEVAEYDSTATLLVFGVVVNRDGERALAHKKAAEINEEYAKAVHREIVKSQRESEHGV